MKIFIENKYLINEMKIEKVTFERILKIYTSTE